MKITVEINRDTKFTIEAPVGDIPGIVRKSVELYQAVEAMKAEKLKPLRRFRVSRGNTSPIEILAPDAFEAAEQYAERVYYDFQGPWAHRDRDAEKLARFGDRFSHSLRSHCGACVTGVTVKEVR